MLSVQSALIFLVIAGVLTIFVIGVLLRSAVSSLMQRLRYQRLASETGCRYIGGLTFIGRQNQHTWRTDAFSDENTAHSHHTVFTANLALPKGTRFAIMAPELLAKFDRDNRSVIQKVRETWQQLANQASPNRSTRINDRADACSLSLLPGSNHFKEQLGMVANDPCWGQLVTPALEQLWLDWPGMVPGQITLTAMDDRLEITVNDQILAGCDHWRQFIQLGCHLLEQTAALSVPPTALAKAS